jgi:NADPH:quinone reductase
MTGKSNQPLSGKAVSYSALGGYDVIEVIERQVRAPRDHEVRIKVVAAAANPTDIMFRDPGVGEQTFPFTPGMEAAGIIESVGADISRLRVGEKVIAAVMPRRPEGGAQAEYIVVPAASVVRAPEATTLAQASTLPMNGLTALLALELATLQPGQSLAVSGGAGHLARYAIAIARRQGLKVIADAKLEEIGMVHGYGASIVIERSSDFAGQIRRKLPQGVDALLDTAVLGKPAFGAIRDGGKYIPVRGWGKEPSLRGIEIKPVFVFQALERTEWLELLSEMVTVGEIALPVTVEYPPEQAVEAQQMLTTSGSRNRPVIVFGE